MSVYNAEKYISDAILSILNQTFSDFEFIIIDDGSSDGSLKKIKEFAAKDERIKVIINEKNIGLANSLNRAIDLASGEYIARMDADDISVPDRFEKQIAFLESNPEVYALGGNVMYMDEYGILGKVGTYPSRPADNKWGMFFGNTMAHPAVNLRRVLFTQYGIHYNGNLRTTQDFDLWVQVGKKHQIANLPDILIYYRRHPGAISNNGYELQKKNNLNIRKKLIEETIGRKLPIEVVEATAKPFPSRKFSTVMKSIILILILKKKMHLSKLEIVDQDSIRQNIRFRLGKIIQNSGIKILQFSYKIYLYLCR